MIKDGWTYEQEYVRCGKASCRTCPHGPYWYRYKREGKKLKKEYVGKAGTAQGDFQAEMEARRWDWYDEMLAPGGDKLAAALGVLGLGIASTRERAERAYRQASLANHPDRGGTTKKMQAVNAAWSYLRARYRW